MSENMKSHEWAAKLKAFAVELDSLPEFPVPRYLAGYFDRLEYFYDKDDFLSAVKTLGAGTKGVDSANGCEPRFVFKPNRTSFRLQMDRSGVCRLVRPAEYDCEHLLSSTEWKENS